MRCIDVVVGRAEYERGFDFDSTMRRGAVIGCGTDARGRRIPSNGDFGIVTIRFDTLGIPDCPAPPTGNDDFGSGSALNTSFVAFAAFVVRVSLSSSARLEVSSSRRRSPKCGDIGIVGGRFSTLGTPTKPPR